MIQISPKKCNDVAKEMARLNKDELDEIYNNMDYVPLLGTTFWCQLASENRAQIKSAVELIRFHN